MVDCEISWQEEGVWKSLPYEIASAMVRTLMLHISKVEEAKQLYVHLLGEDASESKMQKAKNELDALKNVERYIVLNPRSGQIASQEWLNKHIKVINGVPSLKKEKTSIKLWVMTLYFSMQAQNFNLKLKVAEGKPDLKVRCLDLTAGTAQTKIQFLLDGYSHFTGNWDEEDQGGSGEEGGGSDNGSDMDSMIGDEAGIPGALTSMLRGCGGMIPSKI